MKILAFFTLSGTPATGLVPTIRIRDLSDNSLVVTDAAMTEVGDGHYQYDFTTYDKDTDYAVRCDGGMSLTGVERYTYAGNENYIDDIADTITETTSADFDLTQELITDVNIDVLAASASSKQEFIDLNTRITSLSGDIGSISVTAAPCDLTDVTTQITSLSASNQANFDTVNTNISNVNTNILAVSASIIDVSNDLKRLLGLTHENIFIDNPVYDGDCNMTSARVRIYSDPASVGTNSDVIGTYTITAPSSAPGKFITWSQVRV